MKRFIHKISYSMLTMFLAVSAVFIALRLTPGDPVERILGPEASGEEIEIYRSKLGLNEPLFTQFKDYLEGVFTGDLGVSLFKDRPVFDLIVEHFPATMWIAVCSILFSSVIGVTLGLFSGVKKSTTADYSLRLVSLVSLSFPIYSLASILVLVFSIKLGWFPVSEWGGVKHAVLPILSLTIPLSSVVMRVTRNKFLEEFGAPWVQVLRAKGLRDGAIIIRVLKVCLTTILNVVAIQLSVVLAGTMITEAVFDIPGMGMLLFDSIQNRDYPVVQGVIAYSTVIYMGVYFLVDFINEGIDPRIKG